MKRVKAEIPADPSAEIDALIEVLHQTGQRLEQLTGGEVDSVMSQAGRPFLLQHAQDRLRMTEATKQASILNALPANIALLDTQGFIVSVNQSWRRFGAANAAHNPGHEVGINYLSICDQARGADSAEALQASAGIRSVLSGAARHFTLEYPCHSPTEQRWFMMTVTPLSEDKPNGVVVMHADISERKQIEREKIKNLDALEASLNEIYIFDADSLCFDYANEGARRNLGYTMEEMRRQTPLDFKPEFSEATFNQLIGPLRRHEKPKIVFQTVHRRANGSIYPVEVHLQLVERAGKAAFLAVINDITERKQAEQALRTSMEEFRTLAESMPQIVWITRADGWNIYFNQHWMDYTGLRLAESLGHGWNKPFHPDDQQQAWDAWQTAIATNGIYSIESRIRRADGAYRWWLVRGIPLLDASGQVLKWFGTCTDIHDLKMAGLEIARANRELHESERRFSDLLGNVQLVSVMLDREARISYCNDYLLRLTGWKREEVLGKDWGEVFVPPELNAHKDAVFAQLLAGRPEALHHENEIRTRSGERRLIRWSNSVLRSGTGEVSGTASIGEDITERRKTDDKIKHLNRLLLMLSSINALIVRVRDRDELFKEACNIAVDAGGFRMATLVIVDPVTRLPVSIASTGKNAELLAEIKNVFSSVEDMQKTLVWQALREKKACIANDAQNDSRLLLGRLCTQAGVKSMTVLPLIVSGEAVGVFALYADEIEFFKEDEMKFLSELAGDIAFASDYIDKQERLQFLAYYDVLTGLANRALFLERATQHILCASKEGHKLVIGLIDLERFKNINDTFGRPAGDALLKQVAEWLTQFARNADLLSRTDADHFAFVLPKVLAEGNLITLFDNFVKSFQAHTFHLGNSELRLSVKLGIAFFPEDGQNVETVYGSAEAALKTAKKNGDRYLFHTKKMTDAVAAKLALENQLRQAIDNEEFVLHYQPKVNLVSGMVTGAEALIRWNDPRTGLVPPSSFIPILEETGLIYEVGRWALRKALEDNLRWRAAGLPAIRIAVNVSPLQLRNSSFIDEIGQVVAFNEQAASGLELEITESLIMEDVNHTITSLRAVRALGVTIAIDDFGTGFSSLSYLAKLPVDTLKIDRSFVVEMDTAEGMALVSTIIILAHALKLKVVAEGVETDKQLRQLLSLGCDEMQGFIVSKPLPAEIFEANFLRSLPPVRN